MPQANPAADRNAEFVRFDPKTDELYLPDGRRITDQVVEHYAEIAERQGPPAGLIPGGKSLSGGRQHSPQITVTLSTATNQALRERAAAEKMSVSRWTRRLIEREVAGRT
ncbi:MAG: DNA-binding protein [Micrococcales bacterium]|nr:DNA-binding protein [Micrococcales bacterium]